MSILAAFTVPHPPMIVPAVGKGEESTIEETTAAYERVADEIAALEPDTIIITSPHSVMYADYFHLSPGSGASGSLAQFGAPGVAFEEEYDEELVQKICAIADEADFPAGTLGEKNASLDHATIVPLYFIRKKYKGGKIVRSGLSGLPLAESYRFGQMIKAAADELGRKAVFVASGDLSHKLKDYGPYGFDPSGPVYDQKVMDTLSRGAFGELLTFDETLLEDAAECGHRSFVIMAGAMDGMKVRASAYSHQDVTGVGYGVCSFYPEGEDPDRKFLDQYMKELEEKAKARAESSDPYVKLARRSLETYIRTGSMLDLPDDVPQEMLDRQAGAFVSIHEKGALRGCIGTILPTQDSVAEEILRNAVSASTRDPRFAPITESELPLLEISVDVLGEPERIASKDELDVKKYGVIVRSGAKCGLLLPDLDGVDTPDRQIEIASRKGGIGPDDDVTLERFEVVRHE